MRELRGLYERWPNVLLSIHDATERDVVCSYLLFGGEFEVVYFRDVDQSSPLFFALKALSGFT